MQTGYEPKAGYPGPRRFMGHPGEDAHTFISRLRAKITSNQGFVHVLEGKGVFTGLFFNPALDPESSESLTLFLGGRKVTVTSPTKSGYNLRSRE